MDPEEPALCKQSWIIHLKVLKARLRALQDELLKAKESSDVIDEEMLVWDNKFRDYRAIVAKQNQEDEQKLRRDIQEAERQLEIGEEILKSKQEEQARLLAVIKASKMDEIFDGDFNRMDWQSLNTIVAKTLKRTDAISEDKRKLAPILAKLTSKAKLAVSELVASQASFLDAMKLCNERVEQFKEELEDWTTSCEEQDKRIRKVQNDNERLKLLIKQCSLGDESITAFVTENVRATCHSFLDSANNPGELLDGLLKFKDRQDRIIKLLRHKESILLRDTNRLRVAADETADHKKFYSDMMNCDSEMY